LSPKDRSRSPLGFPHESDSDESPGGPKLRCVDSNDSGGDAKVQSLTFAAGEEDSEEQDDLGDSTQNLSQRDSQDDFQGQQHQDQSFETLVISIYRGEFYKLLKNSLKFLNHNFITCSLPFSERKVNAIN
jgi:hypothetical protein